MLVKFCCFPKVVRRILAELTWYAMDTSHWTLLQTESLQVRLANLWVAWLGISQWDKHIWYMGRYRSGPAFALVAWLAQTVTV